MTQERQDFLRTLNAYIGAIHSARTPADSAMLDELSAAVEMEADALEHDAFKEELITFWHNKAREKQEEIATRYELGIEE